MTLRPLQRVGAGHWLSHDGQWTFLRHWSDPHPQRWFAYRTRDGVTQDPVNDGSGDVTLSDAVDSVAEMLAQAALPNPGGLEFRVRR